MDWYRTSARALDYSVKKNRQPCFFFIYLFSPRFPLSFSPLKNRNEMTMLCYAMLCNKDICSILLCKKYERESTIDDG